MRNIETTMNGQAPVSACDMVVKVVPDLAKVGEILEEVETEEERLVLDMRSLPEEDMQVLPLISLLLGYINEGVCFGFIIAFMKSYLASL